MCGFIGYLSAHPHSPQSLYESFSLIAYRGFVHGSYWESTVALCCTRLPRSGDKTRAQPVVTNSGDVCCLNGQIYNSAAINPKRILIEQEASDTELLADWLSENNANVGEKLRLLKGEFALAFISKDRSLVHLARDSFGSKPLFWAFNKGVIAFGSSARAVATVSFGRVDLDLDEFSDNFWFGVSSSGSCFKGVFAVKPGTCMSISHNGEIKQTSLTAAQSKPLAAVLENAVHQRIAEPEHTYVSFSGGVDSLLVARQAPNIKRLTLDVPSPYRGSYSTTKVSILTEDLEKHLPLYAQVNEKPLISLTGVALLGLANFASSRGFSSSLTGEGADEIFGGYHHYFVKAEGHPQIRYALLSRNLFSGMLGGFAFRPLSPFISSINHNPHPSEWLKFDRLYRLPQHICSANSDIPTLLAGIDVRMPYLDLIGFSIRDTLPATPKSQLYSLARSIPGFVAKKQGLYIQCSSLWEKLPIYIEECQISLFDYFGTNALKLNRLRKAYIRLEQIPESEALDLLKEILARIILALWSTTRMLSYHPHAAPVMMFTKICKDKIESRSKIPPPTCAF